MVDNKPTTCKRCLTAILMCFALTIAITASGAYRNLRAAEARYQIDQASQDSSAALHALIAEILDSITKKDSARASSN